MDQNTLVNAGHVLVTSLDQIGHNPRLAMWVHSPDTDTWKLWIVPPVDMKDKQEFYRIVSEVVTKNRADLGDINASDTEMIPDTHPAVHGLRGFLHMPELGSAHFSGNRFNGFYLPDGIILRVNL